MQENVITQPAIPSVIGVLLAALYNPNLGWDHSSRRVALAEMEVSAIIARLIGYRSEEHTSELQSQSNLVCRLLLDKKKHITSNTFTLPVSCLHSTQAPPSLPHGSSRLLRQQRRPQCASPYILNLKHAEHLRSQATT